LDAIYDLGLYYEERGDFQLAVEYYKKGTAMGDPFSGIRLADMYAKGYGIPKDDNKSTGILIEAAASGDSEASYLAALRLLEGKGVEANIEKAVNLMRIATNQLYVPALLHMGTLYESGTGVEKSYEAAAELYLTASRQNSAEGCMRLAHLYEYGMGVEINAQTAFELYTKALSLGEAYAAMHIGNYYKIGFGVEKNYLQARKMYETLIGKSGGIAEYKIGILYRDGLGVEKNNYMAEYWLIMALKAGNHEAFNQLGKMYMDRNLKAGSNVIGCAYIYQSYVEKDIAYCDSILTTEQKSEALKMKLPVYE
jgi:TPR repeat protein